MKLVAMVCDIFDCEYPSVLAAARVLPFLTLREELLELIEAGLNINESEDHVIFECLFDDYSEANVREKVSWLIESGMDPYLGDVLGNNVIHMAAHSGFPGLACDLKKLGLDPLRTNHDGWLPSEMSFGGPSGDFILAWEYEVADTWGELQS